MNTTEQKLPKPTVEIVKEYEEVDRELDGLDPSWTEEEANAAIRKWSELENSYDWSNVEFTDPTTGKKGLKNLKGELMVPALYDAFPEPGVFFDPWEPIVAVLNGKYGILSGKGDAETLIPFEYDRIAFDDNRRVYVGHKGDQEEFVHPFGNDDSSNTILDEIDAF